jgi:hypothetical protein
VSNEEWEVHVNLSFSHTLSFLCGFCNGNPTVIALEYRRHSRRRVFTLVHPHLREKDCFLSQSDVIHLLILGVEGYCCTWSHSVAHTHTHTLCRTPLDEGSACRRDFYLATQKHSRETDRHAPDGIPTRNPSKRLAADPRLRTRGHRDLRIKQKQPRTKYKEMWRERKALFTWHGKANALEHEGLPPVAFEDLANFTHRSVATVPNLTHSASWIADVVAG